MSRPPDEGQEPSVEGDPGGSGSYENTNFLRPNMLLANGNAVSSSFSHIDMSHSIMTRIRAFNTRVHQSNFEGGAFDECDLDGATFTGCSMRGVEFVNCDVDRMIVNGVNVGNLLRLLIGEEGRI